jgi:hypothetical protein
MALGKYYLKFGIYTGYNLDISFRTPSGRHTPVSGGDSLSDPHRSGPAVLSAGLVVE